MFSAIPPLSTGLVKDSMHPGSSITGVADQMPMDKHLDMIRRFCRKWKKIELPSWVLTTICMARKILTGTRPGALPVGFQKDLSFHINPKAAERMGVYN